MKTKGSKLQTIKVWGETFQPIAVIISVVVAATSLYYIEVQTKIQTIIMQESRNVESAKFVLQVDNNLNQDRYRKIIEAVEGGNDNAPHSSSYPVLTKGIKPHEVDDYLANFNNVGLLLDEGLINENMAYTEFSYGIEKVFCNKEILSYVRAEREASGDLSGDTAYYGYAEELALKFMKMDNYKNCDDLDAHDGSPPKIK